MSGRGKTRGGKNRRGSTRSQAVDGHVADGDNGAWPCEICKVSFTSDDSKVLICDYCELYFCTACVKVSDEQYTLMSTIPGTCWFCHACQRKARDCIKTEKQIEERCAEYCKKLEARITSVETDLSSKVSKDDVRDVVRAELTKSNNWQQEDLKKITMAVAEHQKYLESLEAQKRASNLIVTGIPETDMVVDGVSLSSDFERCAAVLRVVGEDRSIIKTVSRLGKAPTSSGEGRPRIIKVQLESSECRTRVLGNSKSLKDAGAPFSRVYIKKDTHPLVNREFQRLKKVTQEEKEKPENQGRTVLYDHDKRQVLVDDVVVDEFRPTFF